MAKLISSRGTTVCRGCGSNSLSSVLDLGSQPLPSEYGLNADTIMDIFPLHLRVCEECGLGQVGEYVLPERIFHKKYPYLSSASTTWIKHAKNYAKHMKETLNLNETTLVIEIASNDGYLLSELQKLGIPVLGIEPAANVASIAQESGVPTVVDFFGEKVAKEILKKHGHPRLIVANNVYAHIPDMHDFTEGISVLSDNSTVVTIENPSFTTLLKNTLFDTIYHEHYSYLTAHSIQKIARTHNLELVHIDKLVTHGGSNRYWLSKSLEIDNSVKEVLIEEKNSGLFDSQEWMAFANRSKTMISDFSKWLIERKEAKNKVVAYGAAHKGNTFLNSAGEVSKNLIYVIDASQEKQGKFLPGSQLPVKAPEDLNSVKPTDVLILPWNISSEIEELIKVRAPEARIWVAQPKMRRLK